MGEPFKNTHDPGGQFLREPAVQFEVTMPGPIERVWELLTDTAGLPEWFGNSIIEPRVGGHVTLLGGHVHGVVTPWTPPRLLVYTWTVYGPGNPSPTSRWKCRSNRVLGAWILAMPTSPNAFASPVPSAIVKLLSGPRAPGRRSTHQPESRISPGQGRTASRLRPRSPGPRVGIGSNLTCTDHRN